MSTTLHERVTTLMLKILDRQASVDVVTPSSLARSAIDELHEELGGMTIQYLSFEQAKQIARGILARRYDDNGEDSDAYQGELFSGVLQRRYPVAHKRGEEPAYCKLELLADHDLQWNEDKLRKSAQARLEHADALRAYRLSR